ncbi:hypothetical protein ACF0H5_006623 [Mactra antiquata]
MFLVGIFVISCLIQGVPAPHGHATKLCRDCKHLSDPDGCHTFGHCAAEEFCGTEVTVRGTEVLWSFGCKAHECNDQVNVLQVLGKRAGHHGEPEHLVCRECCSGSLCDANLCTDFRQHLSWPPATSPPATNPPATDPPATDAPVTDAIVTDVPSTAVPMMTSTVGQPMTDIVNIVVSVTQAPPMVTDTVVVASSEAPLACVDVEDPTLSCAELKNLGFCAPGSGSGHTFAEIRCPKTCNLC